MIMDYKGLFDLHGRVAVVTGGPGCWARIFALASQSTEPLSPSSIWTRMLPLSSPLH